MTASTSVLDAIAAARAALTPAQIAAKTAALNTSIAARIQSWTTLQAQIDALDGEITSWTNTKSTADTAIAAAQTQATSKAASITTLQSQVAAVQAQIATATAGGAHPATADDIAERDEVVALAAEVGVTLP